MSYLFAFSYSLWGSQGKNAEVVVLDYACPVQLLQTKHTHTHTHTHTLSDRLFKYPNYFLCIVIICLHLSLPFPVIILVEGILIQTICFTSTNWVFHLDVINSKLFSLFFATCSPKNNKYPLSTSYIINIQLLKLHSINLFCDLRQESKLLFFHTVN